LQISSLRRGANSKRGVYLKLGAENPDPLRPGGLPYNRDGDARRTIRIKPPKSIWAWLRISLTRETTSVPTQYDSVYFLYQGISLRSEDEIG